MFVKRTRVLHLVRRYLLAYWLYHANFDNPGQVGKVLGERWKALSPTERQPYEDKAKADKERYDAEKASYNVSQPRVRCATTRLINPHRAAELTMMTMTSKCRDTNLKFLSPAEATAEMTAIFSVLFSLSLLIIIMLAGQLGFRGALVRCCRWRAKLCAARSSVPDMASLSHELLAKQLAHSQQAKRAALFL